MNPSKEENPANAEDGTKHHNSPSDDASGLPNLELTSSHVVSLNAAITQILEPTVPEIDTGLVASQLSISSNVSSIPVQTQAKPTSSAVSNLEEFGGAKKKRPSKTCTQIKTDQFGSWDQIEKACQKLSLDEKLDCYKRKYNEMTDQCRMLARAEAEKMNLKRECDSNSQARAQLERLCRELQRQNKILEKDLTLEKNENAEHRKMQAKSSKLEKQLETITKQVKNSRDVATKLQVENEAMSAKFEITRSQFVGRDEEFQQVSVQLEKERKLYEAQIKKQGLLLDQSKKALIDGENERQILLKTIIQLEEKIATYSSHYAKFDDKVKENHQSFANLQKELDRMSSHLTEVDKERAINRKKYEECRSALRKASETCARSDTKITTLERLCRQLQHERHYLSDQLKSLSDQLKSHNIKIKPIPAYIAPPVPHTKKEIELGKLKKELNAAEQSLKKLLASTEVEEANKAAPSDQEEEARPSKQEQVSSQSPSDSK